MTLPATAATRRPRTAVVTVVHGRAEHLRRQHASLLRDPPDDWVVVAVDDPSVARWRPDRLTPHVVEVGTDPRGLPLAAARNAGMRSALERGAEVVVLLDVDCLAGEGLVEAYARAAAAPGTVWCGPVTYLSPAPSTGYDLAGLAALDAPHPGRPAPPPGRQVESHDPDDWRLFWSLSFALHAADVARTGGFCEDYVGYGGEDTDFGQLAREAGLALTWLGSARAYHQHHPVSSPPVEHAVDIVRNAHLFHDRWGWWPMLGWLHELADLGVVHETEHGWRLSR